MAATEVDVWDCTVLRIGKTDQNDNRPNLQEVELGLCSQLKDISDR
jgi:hypothetical protein